MIINNDCVAGRRYQGEKYTIILNKFSQFHHIKYRLGLF